MPDHLRVILSGGGTGGHVFPGLALAAELKRRQPSAEIWLAGSERQTESRISTGQDLARLALPVEPLQLLRKRPLQFAWRNLRAYRQAAAILRDVRPHAVVGLGGYAAVPILLAARSAKISTMLLEQNAVPGRTTRWMARTADLVCLSFAQSQARLPARARCVVTGNPVRQQIADLQHRPFPTLGEPSPDSPPLLLIMGGSQGAHAVNQAMLAAAERLREPLRNWRIVHQTGPTDEKECKTAYARIGLDATVSPFLDDIPEMLATATLAVSRAGATTLAEFACAGLPAVLIPYPHAADDHQRANARVYAEARAARVVEQQDEPDTADRLTAELSRLLEDPAELMPMRQAMHTLARPTAAADVANHLLALIAPAAPPADC